VGYYVNIEYTDADLIENPPDKPIIGKLQRNIMSDHPRWGVGGRGGGRWATAGGAARPGVRRGGRASQGQGPRSWLAMAGEWTGCVRAEREQRQRF
jgi:hypothetical protein